MRAGSTRFAGKARGSAWAAGSLLMLLFVLGLFLCVCAAGAAAATAAAAQTPAASPSPTVSPSPAVSGAAVGDPAPASTITWSLAPASVVYGAGVTVQGIVAPAVEGQTVTIAIDGVTVATPATDASGAFSASFVPTVGGTVTATLADSTTGASYALSVAPKLTLHVGATLPWGRTKLTFAVAPASYTGKVTLTVFHHSRKVAVVAGHAAGGALVLPFPRGASVPSPYASPRPPRAAWAMRRPSGPP